MIQHIRISHNAVEYGFSLELAGRQLSLTAIRETSKRQAHVIISCIDPDSEAEEHIEYSPADFLQMITEHAPRFWAALGVHLP